MMVINKKGVSPLIATVLLIAFAVALGAVVMSWGKGYVEGQTKKVQTSGDREFQCSLNDLLTWWQLDSTDQVCTGGNYLYFTIENGADSDLADIQMVVDTDKNIIFRNESILTETMTKSGIKRFNLTFDNETNGNPIQINLYPKIIINGEQYTCMKRALVETNPSTC